MSVLQWPCPAIFRHKIGRPISDADLATAWAHVPTATVRQFTLMPGGHTAAERKRVTGLMTRVLALRGE